MEWKGKERKGKDSKKAQFCCLVGKSKWEISFHLKAYSARESVFHKRLGGIPIPFHPIFFLTRNISLLHTLIQAKIETLRFLASTIEAPPPNRHRRSIVKTQPSFTLCRKTQSSSTSMFHHQEQPISSLDSGLFQILVLILLFSRSRFFFCFLGKGDFWVLLVNGFLV